MRTLFLRLLVVSLLVLMWSELKCQIRDKQKEQVLEQQLQRIDADAVALFRKATVAMDSMNMRLADSLYTRVYAKAPAFDPLLRRMGAVKFTMGNVREGLEYSRKAVLLNNSVDNLLSLAYLYVVKSDSLNLTKASSLLQQAEMLPEGDSPNIHVLLTQVAISRNDMYLFRKELAWLQQKQAYLPETHYFAAILCRYDEEWFEAKKEILVARDLGLPQETVDELLNSGVNQAINKRIALIAIAVVVAAWMLGMLILFLLGKFYSSKTISAIENDRLETGSSGIGNRLRGDYKKLISIAGIYYYLSLPIVLLLIIAITFGIFYACIVAGTFPIKILLIVFLAAVSTIYSMLRSMLLKKESFDPGRVLQRDEAPALFALVEEVAEVMHTRPADEIRITPLNDLAVYERGSWRDKMLDRGQRILILGTSVLNGFRNSDFKAVLAHEYGHFAHRDTAGGDIAFRVQNDIYNFLVALVKAQQNTLWNISFHFLRLYSLIFRRITHGATRLQEVMADRIAAKTFGVQAFKSGLIHVIRKEIEFAKFANIEIQEAVDQKRALGNIYQLAHETDESVETEIAEVMSKITTDDDTHPSPTDRFRFIEVLEVSIDCGVDNQLVSNLFTDWQALTEEMTKTIEAGLVRS